MQTWHIVLIVAAVIALAWFFFRRKTLPAAPYVTAVDIPTAPGVTPNTGQVAPNPPPPPPAGVTAQLALIQRFTPNAVLSHVPIVGNAAKNISMAPVKISEAVNKTVGKALDHIPIVGSTLSAPSKAISKLTSWL